MDVTTNNNYEIPSFSCDSNQGLLLWQQAQQRLKKFYDLLFYKAYFEKLELFAFDVESFSFIVKVENQFLYQLITNNYYNKILSVLQEVCARSCLLKLIVENKQVNSSSSALNNKAKYVVVKRPIPNKNLKLVSFVKNQLNPSYIFDNFIVGQGNCFASSVAKQVAENLGTLYNPLFLYSNVGLGKTHLLHSVGNLVYQLNPGAKIAYFSSESFTNQLIDSIKNSKISEFKAYIKNLDLLLVDDIQFLAGKERTQEEFFHCFNELYNNKKQIIITADSIPFSLSNLDQKLKARFSSGLIADIQKPDFDNRLAILQSKALKENFNVNADVLSLIASSINSNVRELEGTFNKLLALSKLKNQVVTIDLAKEALKDSLRIGFITPSCREIIAATANYYDIKASQIYSKKRSRSISRPRQIAMFLVRKFTNFSYADIGLELGGRDHSSAIHAVRLISKKLKEDDCLRAAIKKIEHELIGH